MKPTLILHNDWRYSAFRYGDVNLLDCHFDWFAGSSYYFTFRLLGFGFTIGAWDDTENNAALQQIESWREANRALQDDPAAHGIVHVGAQTATVTVEPLNLPSDRDGS